MVDGGEVKTNFSKRNISYTATAAEVDFLSFTNLRDKVIVHISTLNLADPTTIKVRETINGVANHVSSNKVFSLNPILSNFDVGVTSLIYVLDGAAEDMRMTLESAVAVAVDIGINQRRKTRL